MKKTSNFVSCAVAATGVFSAIPSTASAQTKITFKIPAGAIDSVLAEFQRLTGLKVILTQPEIGGLQTPGVAGTLTVQQALDALLAGTKVKATFGPKSIT